MSKPVYLTSTVLQQSIKALEMCLQFKGPADSTLSHFFRNQAKLGQRDRAIIAETVYMVLRFKTRYMHMGQSGSGNQCRRWVLLALSELQSPPVDPRSVCALCTSAEIEWLEHVKTIDVSNLSLELQTNFPSWLLDRLIDQYGIEQTRELAVALNKPAALDLRVNTVKAKREQVISALHQAGVPVELIAEVPDALRLGNKPALQKLPAYTEGSFEVQDVGSQILAYLVAPKRGQMVVDFCAGAGGKTLALGALMRNTGRLYAFDISEGRLAKFKPRLARSGLSNVYPARIEHENDIKIKRLARKMDRVLVDAPCSGMGTLRRNPDLKWRQNLESLHELVTKQERILQSASRLVKPEGRLVYATCSLLKQENQHVVEAFLAKHPHWRYVPVQEILTEQKIKLPITITLPYLQLLPHHFESDGFFAAVLTYSSNKTETSLEIKSEIKSEEENEAGT